MTAKATMWYDEENDGWYMTAKVFDDDGNLIDDYKDEDYIENGWSYQIEMVGTIVEAAYYQRKLKYPTKITLRFE